MLVTIDIKDDAVDNVMYLLNRLSSDIKILDSSLDIETIEKNSSDYEVLLNAKKTRNLKDYVNFNEINWD